MLFEVYAKGKKWRVRHILTGDDVMGYHGDFILKSQAEFYAAEFEKSPFIWYFTDPKDLMVLNNYDDLVAFVDLARAMADSIQ